MTTFASYLSEYGLSRNTISAYESDVTQSGGTATGLLARLRNDELAPKTRRRTLAAARRWADYQKNSKLLDQLKKIRLPPARRKTPKVPVEREELFAIIDELAKADYLSPAMRAVIGMMACRGLRCGDVLRITREELLDARAAGTLSFEAKGNRRLEFKVIKTYRKYLTSLADQPGDWKRVADLLSKKGKTREMRERAAAKAIERHLVKLAVRAGVRGLHPHRLRRTYAVQYLRSLKGDPEALVHLKQHMQWASLETALEYVDHVRGDELDEPAERMFERDPAPA